MKLVIAKDYKRFRDYLKENNLSEKDAVFAVKEKMKAICAREIVFYADCHKNKDWNYIKLYSFCRLRDIN